MIFSDSTFKFIHFRFKISAINKTCEELQADGIACKGYVVDISKRENVFEAAKNLKDEFGGVDILVNNAGIVCCKPLWDLPEKVIENTYNVNILSHYWVNSECKYSFVYSSKRLFI